MREEVPAAFVPTDEPLPDELVKKLLLAWDPDFTKVTPEEAAQLEKAERNFSKGETVSMDEIDWD